MTWNKTVSQSSASSYKLPLTPCSSDLSLPRQYCAECNLSPSGLSYPLPEFELLAPSHPLIEQIRQLHKQFDRARSKTSKAHAAGRMTIEEAQRRNNEEAALPPEKVRDLILELRAELKLLPERKVLPGSRLGVCEVICNTLEPPDFCQTSFCAPPCISRRAIRFLEENKCTGWQTIPARVAMAKTKKLQGQIAPELAELIVTGNAGLPLGAMEGVNYSRCQRCGTIRWHELIDDAALNADEWDGSDLFHFEGMGGIYVTERLKNICQSTGLSGVYFRLPAMPYEDWETSISI